MTAPTSRRLTIIGTAVAILVGLTVLYAFLYPKEPAITALGECSEFSLPASYYSQLKTLSTATEAEAIEKLLPENLPYRALTAHNIRQLFLQNKNLELESQLHNWTTTCKFIVTNDGSKEAQNLRLQFRNTGVYTLKRPGEPDKNETFENAILLGNLQPDSHLELITWNNNYFLRPIFDKVKVTHSEGSTIVDVPRHGLLTYLAERPFNLLFTSAFGILTAAIFVIGFLLGAFVRRVRIIKSTGPDLIAIEENTNSVKDDGS